MILAGLLGVALLQGPAPLADPGEVERRLFASPPSVGVGEPFELVLEIARPAGHDTASAGTPNGELVVDDSWVLFDTRLVPSGPDPARPERIVTRWIWEVASLEPGERDLAVHGLQLDADSDDSGIETCTVRIAGVLAAGEDAPRPLRGFSAAFGAAEAEEDGLPRWAWILVGVMLHLLGLGPFLLLRAWWRRRRKREAPDPPLERLERLRGGAELDAEQLRARHYELSHLLRAATDERLDRDRRAWTDEEWIAEVADDRSLDEAFRREIAAALDGCARVKYAGERPSAWAVDETFQSARAALEVLSAAPGEEGGA